jgi:hypothetical protein
MPAEPVLYTSLERDGALEEIVHHWNRLTPPPSKPVLVHILEISVEKTLVLSPLRQSRAYKHRNRRLADLEPL